MSWPALNNIRSTFIHVHTKDSIVESKTVHFKWVISYALYSLKSINTPPNLIKNESLNGLEI